MTIILTYIGKSRTRDLKQFFIPLVAMLGSLGRNTDLGRVFYRVFGVTSPLVHEELAYTLCWHTRAASWEALVIRKETVSYTHLTLPTTPYD